MKDNFYTQFNFSTFQFISDYFTEKCEAYTEYDGQLFPIIDERLDGFNVYATPYQQLVYDSSITGASIPTGIIANGQNLGREDGIIFDFMKGRILSENELTDVSGIFYAKEINFYKTNESQEKLIIDTKYVKNGNFQNFLTGANQSPYDYILPCIIFSSDSFDSEPFAFGGEEKTTFVCKLTVITDDEFERDAILGAAAKIVRRSYPILSREQLPINEFGDLKNQYYSSKDVSGEDFFISKVYCRKIKDYATKSIPGNLLVGFIDLHVEQTHFLRN